MVTASAPTEQEIAALLTAISKPDTTETSNKPTESQTCFMLNLKRLQVVSTTPSLL